MKKLTLILLVITECLALKLKAQSTYNTFTDARDGKIYKTVTLGYQTWMAENLNYDTIGGYCYHDSISNCKKYGRLYVWKTAIYACPSGWHLPSDEEWHALVHYLGRKHIGDKLKSTSGWKSNANATNSSGFSALPCGSLGSTYIGLGSYGCWWSATEDYDRYAWYCSLHYDDSDMIESKPPKGVRLLCPLP